MATPAEYFLHSERLAFRLWTEHDVEIASGLWGDPRVTALIDTRDRWSRAQVEARLQQEIDRQREHNMQYWPLFSRHDLTPIGCCGLRPYDLSAGALEIGFHIRHDHWGMGFAYEAAQAVIGCAFSRYQANWLFAGHNPRNSASAQLLRKLGFDYTHDEFYPPTGLNHPSYRLTRK